jgi:hypothetical protein
VKEVAPVPPPATDRVPDCEGVKVRVEPDPVMVRTEVSPFVAEVEVAKVTVGPVVV